MSARSRLISSRARSAGASEAAKGRQVASAFRTVIGSEPAGLCDEVELRSGVLLVTTSSPALAHQLRLDAELIIERLNALQLGRRVRIIRVRIGRSTAIE